MIDARRANLRRITSAQASHAGLWLDRMLSQQIERKPQGERRQSVSSETPGHQVIREAAGIVASEATRAVYAQFFDRWKQHLDQPELRCQTRVARCKGRLAIGLGEESVIETGITLHHTYGFPYIPGSALKGLAASYARKFGGKEWGVESDPYKTVFGTIESAGYVTFFDALYIAGSVKDGRILQPDVITVHHKDYYQMKPGEKQPKAAPADWDNPTPIPFMTATGDYLVALAGPRAWVEVTFTILKKALEELGVGAKTSSGYGRMAMEGRGMMPT